MLARKKGVEVEIFRPALVIFEFECFDWLSEKNLRVALFSLFMFQLVALEKKSLLYLSVSATALSATVMKSGFCVLS